MFKRLLLILTVGTVVLAACAKPPVAELEDTRKVVAYAYASGASRLASEVYQLASEALRTAEDQIRNGRYRDADLSLDLARNYSRSALSLTIQRKQEILKEQARLAEEKRLAAERAEAEMLRKKRKAQAREVADKMKNVPVPEKPLKPAKPEILLVDQIEVAPGANLSTIAAQPEVYRDEMLWPLIYKANRDQIKDPKQIFPGQILLIPRDKSREEIEAARREAEELKLF